MVSLAPYTSHSVVATFAVPSHPLQEPVCLHEKNRDARLQVAEISY